MSSFPLPSQIEAQYLRNLKSLKPSINTNDQNSDFVIRGKVFSGMLSGLYGDQKKINNDTYISTCRPEVLEVAGLDYNLPKQQATQAVSPQIRIFGDNGTIINPGDLTFMYVPTSILYSNTTGGTISGGQLDVTIRCEAPGQNGNVLAPDTLNLVSPPSGVQVTSNVVQSIADGSDVETNDSYRTRLLNRKQFAPSGGNVTDYPNFAFAANSSVRSAKVKRFGRGLGTVDIYITAGTTDIDTAVTQGIDVSRVPSSLTIQQVQDYYFANVPLTDCPRVYGPSERDIFTFIKLTFAPQITSPSTYVPTDATLNPEGLTCIQLVHREIARALYKNPVGGRITTPSIPNSAGYVFASDIEENIDMWLSAVTDQSTGLPIGKIPILIDRQVTKLNSDSFPVNNNTAIEIAPFELSSPGIRETVTKLYPTINVTVGI